MLLRNAKVLTVLTKVLVVLTKFLTALEMFFYSFWQLILFRKNLFIIANELHDFDESIEIRAQRKLQEHTSRGSSKQFLIETTNFSNWTYNLFL